MMVGVGVVWSVELLQYIGFEFVVLVECIIEVAGLVVWEIINLY